MQFTARDPLAAAEAAKNETLNNWLHPREQTLKQQAGKACQAGQETGCQIQRMLQRLDAERENTPSAKFAQGFVNAMALAGGSTLLMPVEIVQAVAEGRSLDALANVLKGIAGLPSHLATGLSSSNPVIQGAAVAESLMLVGGAAALAKNVVTRAPPADTLTAARKVEDNFYRDGAAVEYARAFNFQPGRMLAAEEANARTVAYGDNALNPQVPYARGTRVTERLAQLGEKLYVIELRDAEGPGAWAAQKPYTSMEQAHQALALLPEFKSGDLVVREYTVLKPTPVREGTVGSLTSRVDGKTYAGGGRQTEFVFDVRRDWNGYLRRTDSQGTTIR
jgi:hypothetical protein